MRVKIHSTSGGLGTGQGGRSQTPRQTRLPFENLERESEDVDELQAHSADIRVRRLGHVVTLAAPISAVETPAHRRSERGGARRTSERDKCRQIVSHLFSPRKLKEEESNRPRQRETSPKECCCDNSRHVTTLPRRRKQYQVIQTHGCSPSARRVSKGR